MSFANHHFLAKAWVISFPPITANSRSLTKRAALALTCNSERPYCHAKSLRTRGTTRVRVVPSATPCIAAPFSRRSFFSELYMSAVEEDQETYTKTAESTWDVAGLKKEVNRLILRAHKKVGKANQKFQNAQQKVEELRNNDDATLEELENCPDINSIEIELQDWQERLQKLNKLEQQLQTVKGKKTTLPSEIAELAIELSVNDEPPPRPQRGPKKPKGPRGDSASRKPYRRYFSFNNIEIRVGKKAEDNDQLSISPKHRDGSDWWMHASGCPGSHVVIRYGGEDLPKEVIQDAAALAARQSKCQGSVIKVSLTRCRDVKKPPGAKAGLVQITGKVQTIVVNMKEAESRFERLEKTVLIN